MRVRPTILVFIIFPLGAVADESSGKTLSLQQFASIRSPRQVLPYLFSKRKEVRQFVANILAGGRIGALGPDSVLTMLAMLLVQADSEDDNVALLRNTTLRLLHVAATERVFEGDPYKLDALSAHMVLRNIAMVFDLELLEAALQAGVANLSAAAPLWDGEPRDAWGAPSKTTCSATATARGEASCSVDTNASMSMLHLLMRTASITQLTELLRATGKLIFSGYRAVLPAFAVTALSGWEMPIKHKASGFLNGAFQTSEQYQSLLDGALKQAAQTLNSKIQMRLVHALEVVDEILAVACEKVVRAAGVRNGGDSGRWLLLQLGAIWDEGRTVLHTIGELGCWRVLGVLSREARAGGPDTTSALARACVQRDLSGRTPAHLAAIAWGAGPMVAALADCAAGKHRAYASDESLPFTSVLGEEHWHLVEALGADAYGETVRSLSAAHKPHWQRLLTAPDPVGDDNGGWATLNDHPPDKGQLQLGAIDELERADVIQLNFTRFTAGDLTLAGRTGRPTLFRGGALNWTGRAKLRRETFLREFGDAKVFTSTVPYCFDAAHCHSVTPGPSGVREAQEETTLREYVEKRLGRGVERNPSLLYVFNDQLGEQSALINEMLPAPLRELLGAGMSRHETSIGYSFSGQLYLGGRGTGAEMHFHNDAVNMLAWGRKRWLLCAPATAFKSYEPAADTFQRLETGGAECRGGVGFELIQEASDVLFVPASWSHSTINLQESVGVAYELFQWLGASRRFT